MVKSVQATFLPIMKNCFCSPTPLWILTDSSRFLRQIFQKLILKRGIEKPNSFFYNTFRPNFYSLYRSCYIYRWRPKICVLSTVNMKVILSHLQLIVEKNLNSILSRRCNEKKNIGNKCPWKHEKTPTIVAYFSLIEKKISTTKNDLVCPDSWKLT